MSNDIRTSDGLATEPAEPIYNTPTNTLEELKLEELKSSELDQTTFYLDGMHFKGGDEAVNKALIVELKNLLKNSGYKSYVLDEQIEARIKELETPSQEGEDK